MSHENGTPPPPSTEMGESVWDEESARGELARLMSPGLLGFYQQCEVTLVFLRSEDRKTVRNALTVVVLEEEASAEPTAFRILNPNPIQLKSIRSVAFGVARYRISVTDLLPALEQLVLTRQWTPPDTVPLCFGVVAAAGRRFVPPDSNVRIPWNHVLKNNFWKRKSCFRMGGQGEDPSQRTIRAAAPVAGTVRPCTGVGAAAVS